jgi:zinc and cadmium transporter
MTLSLVYIFASVLLVSLVSLIGVFTLSIKQSKLDKVLMLLVSLSAGSLIGGAFFHLMPEIVEERGFGLSVSLSVIGGILMFFLLEKLIHWRHCHHSVAEGHHHHLAIMNIVGDGVHNLMDGIIIATTYLVSIPAGIATTIAVLLHEVPQEIGDFGVLVYSGMSRAKALLMNFLSALIAVIGAIIGIVVGSYSQTFVSLILPFAAGGFIYIAGSDLLPELHRECHTRETFWKESAGHIFMLLLGIGLMLALTWLE